MRNDFRGTKAAVKGFMWSSVADFLQTGKDAVHRAAAERKLMIESRMWRWCSRWWSSDPPQTASILKEAWGILANDLPSIHQSIPHLLLHRGSKVRASSSAALSWFSSGNLQDRWHAGTFQHIPSPPQGPLPSRVCSRDPPNERPPRPAPFYMKKQQLGR